MGSSLKRYFWVTVAGLSLVLILTRPASSQELCDVNQDGKTTTGDALTVLKAAVGQAAAVHACTPTTTTTTLPLSNVYFERNWTRKNGDGLIVASGKVILDATSSSVILFSIVVDLGTSSAFGRPKAVIQNQIQYQTALSSISLCSYHPGQFCYQWNNQDGYQDIYAGVTATATITKPFPAAFDYDAPFRFVMGFFANPADDYFDVVP